MIYYAPIWTDGEMSNSQVMGECVKEKFVPIFALHTQEQPTIILFQDAKIALQFLKRNAPPKWPKALFQIEEQYFPYFDTKGWNYEIWQFPKKIQDLPHGCEIIETDNTPDLHKIYGTV